MKNIKLIIFSGLALLVLQLLSCSRNRGIIQVAEVTVKNGSGTTLATTRATVPTSDEINCAKCHGTATTAFDDVLSKHDAAEGTSLSNNKPVLCARCHPSPALGITTGPQMYLSKAIHGYHASNGASCYDCHPGARTKCNRSLAHNNSDAADGNCITCHGDLATVASSITGGREGTMGIETGMYKMSFNGYLRHKYRIGFIQKLKRTWEYVLFRMPGKSSCHVSFS